jgi:hypothetical protein
VVIQILFYRKPYKKPDSMMNTYNLIQVVKFPSRISNDKGTLIDNTFLDFARLNHYSVYPVKNGLLDHDAQILALKKLQIPF